MNIKEQENDIVKTLLECNTYLHKKQGLIKKVGGIIDLNLYSYNFKNLYCDINDVSLNESKNISFGKQTNIKTYLDNPYAYLQKVSRYIKNYSREVVVSLNESLQTTVNKGKQNDISTYQKDLNKLINNLKKQNDLINVDKNILRIKQQLNRDVLVKGFDVNSFFNRRKIEQDSKTNIFSVLYDISNDIVIFTTTDEKNVVKIFCMYDVAKDKIYFNKFDELYQYGEYDDYIKYFGDKYNKTGNYLKYIKNSFGQSITNIYTDVRLLGLKYTDNMYADQAQKSLAADVQKARELFNNSVKNERY